MIFARFIDARVLLVSLALGAASACEPARAPVARPARGEIDVQKTFATGEEEVLRDLAAIDRRIARRARVTPTEEDLRRVAMAALLHEDPTVAIVAGAIDPFSFGARARGLDAAKRKITMLPAAKAESRTNEHELLLRLVDEELLRLEAERELPGSASSLVRAMVDTWQTPKTREEAAEADRWLTRRLRELRESVVPSNDQVSSLDVVRARELDDALDALERLMSTPGFTTATQELVRVRDALEGAASKPAINAQLEWVIVARRARPHLGNIASPEVLARELRHAERDLRNLADKAMASAHMNLDELGPNLHQRLFVSGPCIDAVPGSPVRSMAAPQEREPACHLRHLVSRAEDDASRAIAIGAMHEHVVVAQWALDVARGVATVADAQDRHRLLVPALPDTRARYERFALARPVAALAAAETARVLLEGDPRERASAWTALGNVPLDIARRELAKARR